MQKDDGFQMIKCPVVFPGIVLTVLGLAVSLYRIFMCKCFFSLCIEVLTNQLIITALSSVHIILTQNRGRVNMKIDEELYVIELYASNACMT